MPPPSRRPQAATPAHSSPSATHRATRPQHGNIVHASLLPGPGATQGPHAQSPPLCHHVHHALGTMHSCSLPPRSLTPSFQDRCSRPKLQDHSSHLLTTKPTRAPESSPQGPHLKPPLIVPLPLHGCSTPHFLVCRGLSTVPQFVGIIGANLPLQLLQLLGHHPRQLLPCLPPFSHPSCPVPLVAKPPVPTAHATRYGQPMEQAGKHVATCQGNSPA